MPNNNLLYYLPWANLEEPITIGQISFIPFKKRKRGVIPRQNINFLKGFFSKYKNIEGKTADGITLCEFQHKYLFDASDKDIVELIKDHINILTFIIISKLNLHYIARNYVSIYQLLINRKNLSSSQEQRLTCMINTPPGSERFKLSSLNLGVQEQFITLRFGKREYNYDDFKKIRILNLKPQSAEDYQIQANLFIDEIELFTNFLSNCSDIEIKNRIFTSLDFYSFVRTESEFIDITKKMVFFLTAFESLLDSSPIDTKKDVVKKINTFTTDSIFLSETRTDNKGKPRTASKIAYKIWDCYDLRSEIVHGKKRISDESEIIEFNGNYKINTLMTLDLVFSYILIKTIIGYTDFSDIRKNYYETPFLEIFSKLGYARAMT